MSDDVQLHTVGQALQYCSEALENGGGYCGHGTDNAWDESVQLVLSVADLPLDSDEVVLSQPLNAAAKEKLRHLLHLRIAERIPLPYLLGRAWFAGLEFICDERAIIPRSPIAELILAGFRPWYAGPDPTRVLDLCCGGGCIGLAVAHYYPGAVVDLVDIDPPALALARENCRRLDLEERVTIIESDLLDALQGEQYDIILSNPPYVNAEDLAAMPAEFFTEPTLALASGPDGLDITRRILAAAGAFLTETGLLVVEVGNSWPDLETRFPVVPFTWLEFEHGGEGVFALTARELQKYGASWD
jgi:ribosomal protein L3 glutamine methyltransferase